MGESPYQTPLQLWEERTKRKAPQETNFAMARGISMEPRARADFELTHNIEMPPVLGEHPEHPFIRASLDGYNAELNVALEIKCCGKKNFELVKSGIVPIDYKAQIQQQILVSGASKVYLHAFNGSTGATLEVLPDIEYCKILLKKLIEFWGFIQNDTPPPADPARDYEVIADNALEDYCKIWKAAKEQIELHQIILDDVEEKIRTGLQVQRAVCNGLRLTKSQRKGGIDYKSIKELEGVDLEKYRRATTESFRISLIGKRDDKES